MRKILALGVLSCLLALAGCDSKPDAPFGFKWGQSVESVKNAGLAGFKVSGELGSTQFVVVNQAPEGVPDSDYYLLTFSPSNGLDGINMFSKGVDESSYYFNDGKVLYNKMAGFLEEKYGNPVKVNEKVKKDGDDFYFCIQDESCGSWERGYERDGVKVELSVKSGPGIPMAHRPKGNIQITYDYFTDEMKNKEKAAYEEREHQEADAAKKNNY